jgi:hypothetical protein
VALLLDAHFLSGISPSLVLSVAMDASDILFWVFDCPAGVRLRLTGGASMVICLFFGWGEEGGGVDLDLLFFGSCLQCVLTSLVSGRGEVGFREGLSFSLVLLFEPAAELDDDFLLLLFELLEDEATDVREGVLPRRRDSWSKVLIASVREALDRCSRDS